MGTPDSCAQAEAYFVGPQSKFPVDFPGYVYVIRWSDDGPVKIGMAVDPLLRLADLQGGNWAKLNLIAVVPIWGYALTVERAAHRVAADYRIRGEWFDLEPIEAVTAILAAARQCGIECHPLDIASQLFKTKRGEEFARQHAADEIERRRLMRVKLGIDD